MTPAISPRRSAHCPMRRGNPALIKSFAFHPKIDGWPPQRVTAMCSLSALLAMMACGLHGGGWDRRRGTPIAQEPPIAKQPTSKFESLWAQGARQVGGTAFAESEAFGKEFVIAGYARDTEFGPIIQRVTYIARCDSVREWPTEVRDRWIVATGRLTKSDCIKSNSEIALNDCYDYLLTDCRYEVRVRAEDVASSDYDRINGPWGDDTQKLSLGQPASLEGQFLTWRDKKLLRWERGTLELVGCQYPAGPPLEAGAAITASGTVRYEPCDLPEGTIEAALVGTTAGRLSLTECVVRRAD